VTIRLLTPEDLDGAVALQRACFPAPFPEEFLWRSEHLLSHIELFPEGQFVATESSQVIGSASNCLISEANWRSHQSWDRTVGGPFLRHHDPLGTTLYGLDISVHPAWRGKGVGRALYGARFKLVRDKGLTRYGTACRIPGYLEWSRSASDPTPEKYAAEVGANRVADRTLTPLLRYGLRLLDVIHDYMDDEESANCAALLEWMP